MLGANALARLCDWLTLKDYTRADSAATIQAVKRYSRGNVSVQDGRFLTEIEMAARAADMAPRLPRMIARYKSLAKN